MTPQELKASVLQYALQGKLVAHEPIEGTGQSEVLKMQKHKERLQKSKEIKKEKPLPPLTDCGTLYDIPDNWCWERVGNVGSWSSGATPSRTNPEYYGGNIPWLKTGDLNDGFVSTVPEFITDVALEKTSVRLNPVGSVLMAMYGATIGKLGILEVPMTTNQACCACIPFDGMLNTYLFYFLMGNRLNFIRLGEGGAQPNISKEKIVNFPIAIPPLAEQKRIVAKLEEILPLIDRYEAAWNKLEEFNKHFPGDMQKSILQLAIQGKLVEQRPEEGTGEELFQQIQTKKQALIKAGKIKKEKPLPEIAEDEIPFDVPETWKWVRLKEIATKITDGTHHSPPNFENGEYMYVTAKNIKDFGIMLSNITYVSGDVHREIFARCNPELGDVLLIKDGATTGVVTVNNLNEPFSMLSSVALLKMPENMCAWYLVYVLRSDLFHKALRARMKGTGITRITLKQIEPMLIPLPPLDEQKRIVAKLEEILPLCDRLK